MRWSDPTDRQTPDIYQYLQLRFAGDIIQLLTGDEGNLRYVGPEDNMLPEAEGNILSEPVIVSIEIKMASRGVLSSNRPCVIVQSNLSYRCYGAKL